MDRYLLFSLLMLNVLFLAGQENTTRIVTLGYTSDSFAGVELGYAGKTNSLPEKDLWFYARFSFPILLALKDKSFDSWKIELGATAKPITVGKFITRADLRVFLIHHNQILGTFMPLGLNLCMTPAYQFKGNYLGFQVNWNQTIFTHISHAQYVKNTFTDLSAEDISLINMHPKDGWYNSTGSYFGFGIESGWEMGPQLFLYGDLGIIKFSSPYTGFFDAMMMGQVPFYGNFRLSYKL